MRSAGFVLAGGHSRRMGTDKALLAWRGSTLIETMAREVEAAAGSVVIVGSPDRYSHLGLHLLADLHPGLGPLAGLEAALAATSAEWNLVVACDLPGLDRILLRSLLDFAWSAPPCDAVVAVDPAGNRQPLCAAYHVRALPLVRQRLETGQLKFLDMIDSLHWVAWPAPDAAAFVNINTPEQWAASGEGRA